MNPRARWKTLVGPGLVVAAAPALSGCWMCTTGTCGKVEYVPWDGGFGDAGWVALADGGREFDGGSLVQNGDLTSEACQALCPADNTYWTSCGPDAGLLECRVQCIGGRVPPGQVRISGVDGSAGAWLARMAELESAAVLAFEHLARELDAHGLPQHAQAALGAAADEVRHAQTATRLALGRGFSPRRPRVLPSPVRSLEEVACDNAAEGCGRELIGAAINAHQARAAGDADVRAAMAGIATDEAAHAQLSLDLAGALMPRLTMPQRRRVREA